MKELLFSGMKKLAVILIASVMLLGVVPVGMISRPTTVSAEGEFLRLSPAAETFVSAKLDEQGLSGSQIAPGLQMVGDSYDTYLRFDLSSLLDKDTADVHEAKLRLAVVRGGGEGAVPVRLWLMPDNAWNESMTYQSRPPVLGEIKLAETAVDSRNARNALVELDMTEYVKKWIEDGRTSVSLHLDASGTSIAAVFAGTDYEDKAYRPCLKVVTGDAADPDQPDLVKSWLDTSVTLGAQTQEEIFAAGKGRETYLKFQLNPANIQGAMYLAQLKLEMLEAEEGAELKVYQVRNTDWSRENISYEERPQGEEILAYSTKVPEAGRLRGIDLTDVINDAYDRGDTALTLRITGGEDGLVTFKAEGRDAPRLEIRVSDDARVQAAVEASVHALDQNAELTAITENLLGAYTAADGTRASLSWRAADADTGTVLRDAVGPSGIVQRPQWFEPARKIRATAVITSGGYSRERSFFLTILPEDAPDYADEAFTDMVHIGTAASETQQRLEAAGAPARSRWIAGKSFSFRALETDGAMVLNLACDPDAQNYLTLKTWEGDIPASNLVIQSLQEKDAAPILLGGTGDTPEAEEGFLYQTYPIPRDYTQGRDFVSLRLTNGTVSAAEDTEPQNIYGAYMTQTPYFDPLAFAEQGEMVAGKTPMADTSFYKFLKRLYLVTQQPVWELPGEMPQEPPAADVPEEKTYTWIDQDTHTVLFRDGGDQIAVSMPREGEYAEVHRNALYYDTYSQARARNYYGKLTAVDYGTYQVFQNQETAGAAALPWEEQNLSGVYRDLVSGTYYSFLRDGEMADDSVLPAEVQLQDGKAAVVEPGETMVLAFLADPLYFSDWRVSGINGKSISHVKLTRDLPIASVTVKNVGKEPDAEETLNVVCGIYERGILAGMESQSITVVPGRGEYEIAFDPEILTARPGQTLKIFVEPQEYGPQTMTAKFELP